MDNYQNILIKQIIFVSAILIIFILVCATLIVITRKLQLEKILYFISLALLVFALLFAGKHILDCSLDLYYNSYETYSGRCYSPSRDTLIIYDEQRTKLLALASVPANENELRVVYSKRSRIVLKVETIN